jgi:hypothetical protein
MKFFSILIFSLITLSNCNSQSLENLTLNYNAATRGSSVNLDANSSEIQYSDIEGDKKITLSKMQWKEIEKLVSKIDLDGIQNLTAPSEGSHTDRALIATLSIMIGDETYESVNFDHGNPPIELKELIEKLFEVVQ